MTIEMSGDVRGWFFERLDAALERHGVPASETTRFYLVELLASFADGDAADFDRPLAFQLAEAMETDGPEKIRKLRDLGDSALYLLGFFEDHLERRGLSRSYFVAMGGRAYGTARQLAAFSPREAPRQEAYGELAERFEGYVEALDDVRESTVLRTPQDIVRLYEKWKRTKSPRLAERLRSEGVFPTLMDERTLH